MARARGLGEGLRFFLSFLRRPVAVGSLFPSSATLARAMLLGCDLRRTRVVVELGPGTGAVTGPILEAIGSDTTYLALELDREHVRGLRRRFRRLRVYHDSAEMLPRYMGRYGLGKAEVIVSGLPWTNMPAHLQRRIFHAVVDCLVSDGVFVTFGYVHAWWMPSAVRFRRLLRQRFATVSHGRIVWRNFPPARVLQCREPRRAGPET
jgi:phospholipid N-methyltransferase